MNPALLLIAALIGTAMLLVGVFAALFGWLPLVPAVALAAVGLAVETSAVIAFVRTRRSGAVADGRRQARR
jgi:CHASE2 domain-containing sensor protein